MKTNKTRIRAFYVTVAGADWIDADFDGSDIAIGDEKFKVRPGGFIPGKKPRAICVSGNPVALDVFAETSVPLSSHEYDNASHAAIISELKKEAMKDGIKSRLLDWLPFLILLVAMIIMHVMQAGNIADAVSAPPPPTVEGVK